MKPKTRNSLLFSRETLSHAILMTFAMVATSVADTTWTGATSSDMTNAANYTNGLPGTGNGSLFINNVATNVPVLQSNLAIGWDLNMGTGSNTTGRLDHWSGTFSTGNNNWIIMGFNNGSGPASSTYNLALTSGTGGNYTGFAEGSGSISNFAKINLGWDANTTSTMNVNTSGTITGGEIEVGSTGGGPTSTFNIDKGTVSLTGNFEVGGDQWSAQGGSSVFRMSGGSITTGGEFWGGGNGTSTAIQSGGSISSGAWFVIGRGGNNVASYTMSGNATVTAATTTVGSFAVVGSFAGSQGTLNVGGDALFQTGGSRKMFVGEGGTGTLNLTGNGRVLVNNNVTGDGFRLGGLSAGNGTVNLDGGTLEVAYIAKGAGTGTLNFNGGTLKVASAHTGSNTFLSGLTSANVLGGGAVIDTNGSASPVVVSQALLNGSGGGGLTKLGAGKLTLTGNNTYTGTTTVQQGSLVLAGPGTTPSVDVIDGTIDSNGSIGSLTVADLPTNQISAGAGNAGYLIANSINFLGDARISLRAAGSASEQSIYVDTALTATPASGVVSVDVNNTSGIWTADPVGWDYTIIDHNGTYTGNVATEFAVGTLSPALGSGQSASIVDTGTAIVLRIVGDALSWVGNSSANWNTADINWTTTATGPSSFSVGQAVKFADGASALNVNLSEDVAPGSVEFANINDSYTISSSGGFGITGGASVLIGGGGQVNFQTANDYTGQTNIQNGVLAISGNGSVASSSSIVLGNLGELILDHGTSATYANPIIGSGTATPQVGAGAVTKLGSGMLTLSGANTFTGSFALNAGQLNLNHPTALGSPTGEFILNGGQLDNTSGADLVMTANKPQKWNANVDFIGSHSLRMGTGVVSLTGTRTVNVQANTLSVGSIQDFASGYGLVKTGAGALVMDGGNIGGDLEIQGGIVGIDQNFLAGAPLGSGILQNAGNSASRWTYWNNLTDVSTGLLIRNNDGSHNYQIGLIKRGPNALTLTNNANLITSNVNVDQGKLVLTGSGVYGARNDNGTTNTNLTSYVGWDDNVNSVLEINGATVNYNSRNNPGLEAWRSTLMVGNAGGSAGAVVLNSGTFSIDRMIALGNAGSFGALTQTAGTSTIGGFLAIGGAGSTGVLNLAGGVLNHNGPLTAGGNTALGMGVIHLGGEAAYNCNNTSGFPFWIGENGAGVFSITDTASLTLNPAGSGITLGGNAGSSGVLNLLGGTVTSKAVNGGAGTSMLNFNGGTLVANAASLTFLSGLSNAYVRSGGGTIDNGGNNVTIAQPLLAPAGNGVGVGTLTASGGGFIATPVVTITGDGVGATAVANLDSSGNLTGVTITNSGNGYTTPPTIALRGGGVGNTGAISGVAALTTATSGSMTFKGAAITTLNGINTYTGNTTILSGSTVVVSNTGALTVKPVGNGISSKVSGSGTASFDGTLRIDLSGVSIANGNAWTLVDASTKLFNAITFKVNAAGLGDFTASGDGVTHTLVDGANTWIFNETTGTLGVTVAGGGFESWITGFGLAGSDQDPGDDPDQDGANNVLEYALGRSPAVAEGATSSGTKNGANFELTFERGDTAVANGDVSIFIEYGNDLAGWTPVAVPASSGVVGGVTFTITDGAPNDSVLASIPHSGSSQFFARVKAVK